MAIDIRHIYGLAEIAKFNARQFFTLYGNTCPTMRYECTGGVECTDILNALSDVVCGVECTDILNALSDVVCGVECTDILIALSDIVCIMNVQVEWSVLIS